MRSIFTILLLTTSFSSFAQNPATKEKAQNYYFYKKDGFTEVSTKDSAEFIEVITEPDKGEKLYDVQQFYKDGKVRFIGKSLEVHPINLVGQSVSFYPNGSKKQITTFEYNKPKGETYSYYPNGKQYIVMEFLSIPQKNKKTFEPNKRDTLIKFEYDSVGSVLVENGKGHFKFYDDDFKTVTEEGDVSNYRPAGLWKGMDLARKITFTEKYQNGRLVEGKSVDSSGNHYTYNERTKMPQLKTGLSGFYRNASPYIRYPAYSRENNHQGTVIIRVLVDENGAASHFEVARSVDKYIDEEALRVVKAVAQFVPAEFYGRKEAAYCEIPISFTLRGQ